MINLCKVLIPKLMHHIATAVADVDIYRMRHSENTTGRHDLWK